MLLENMKRKMMVYEVVKKRVVACQPEIGFNK